LIARIAEKKTKKQFLENIFCDDGEKPKTKLDENEKSARNQEENSSGDVAFALSLWKYSAFSA
jgi:hypothetical protein